MFSWLFDAFFVPLSGCSAINVLNENYQPTVMTVVLMCIMNSSLVCFVAMFGTKDLVSVLYSTTCKLMTVLVTFVGLFIIMRPLVVYWLSSERIMMVPVWLPGVDETTSRGYALHFVYHLCEELLAVIGTIGADSLLIAFVLHLWPMCEIFDNTIQMINDAAQFRPTRIPCNAGWRSTRMILR